MTIRLITGIPGSGKTLYAVSELKKAVESNTTAKEPRKIYCDITGLKYENIEPPPIDWRLTPPRSLLIYDEAQLHKEFQPCRGQSPHKFVELLTIHRKSGHEIWFITQDPKRLHNDILLMVETHHHLERPYGAKLASIYHYRGAERNPSARSVKERAENKTVFTYDRSLFDMYESSQVKDGIKFRLPRELTVWLILAVIVGYFFYTQVTSEGTKKYINTFRGVENTDDKQDKQDTQNAQTSVTDTSSNELTTNIQDTQQKAQTSTVDRRIILISEQLPKDYEIIKAEPALQVRGVISDGKKCRAYNAYGDLMTLSKADCEWYLAEKGRVHKDLDTWGKSHTVQTQQTQTQQESSIQQQDTITAPAIDPSQAIAIGLASNLGG